MTRYEPFQIDHAGRRYSATWNLDGRDICVSSAYGSARAPAGRADPRRRAEALFRKLLLERKSPASRG